MDQDKPKGFAVWTIERDSGNGRLAYRKSFVRQDGTARIMQPGTDLTLADDMDGGRAGTIVVPEGCTLGENEAGDTVLVLPNGEGIGADEAWALAKENAYGLHAITGH